jgi:hypothetical protein
MLVLVFSFFYDLFSLRGWSRFQVLLPVSALVLLALSLNTTLREAGKAREVRDRFSGLTPDWVNYCKASEWASANLDAKDKVACWKPSISFIFGKGKSFFGISRMAESPVDQLISSWPDKQRRYYLISASSLRKKPVSLELQALFRRGLVGYGITRDEEYFKLNFYVLAFPEDYREKAVGEFRDYFISITDDIDSLKSWVRDSRSKVFMIYPDTLLGLLARSNVTHVLTDNIRTYTTEKNENRTNLVERYMNCIEIKYPGIRTKIYQEGTDSEEPALIYKLNYRNN